MDLISFGLLDDAGKRRTMPVHIPSGNTDAQIQAFITSFAPLLDAVTGCQMQDVSVTKAFTLPGGLKGSADAGADTRQGALLGFDCAGTDYRHSVYVPGWDEAGYSGDTVDNSGAYATFIAYWPTGNTIILPSDKYENDVTAYIGGEQTFRK